MTAWEEGYWSVLTKRTFTLDRASTVALVLGASLVFLAALSLIAGFVDARFFRAATVFSAGGIAFAFLASVALSLDRRSRR